VAGLASVAGDVTSGKQGSIPSSDGRHTTRFAVSEGSTLPAALLDAALQVSFADGSVVVPDAARRQAPHLPPKITIDETTLRLIAQFE
jgi:hypothetical protein